jgi:heme exporter protein D
MNWGSVDAFFAMGGYALYVWGSYAATFLLMVVEIIFLVSRRRAAAAVLEKAAGAQGRVA